jgi:hypothetical protein
MRGGGVVRGFTINFCMVMFEIVLVKKAFLKGCALPDYRICDALNKTALSAIGKTRMVLAN